LRVMVDGSIKVSQKEFIGVTLCKKSLNEMFTALYRHFAECLIGIFMKRIG